MNTLSLEGYGVQLKNAVHLNKSVSTKDLILLKETTTQTVQTTVNSSEQERYAVISPVRVTPEDSAPKRHVPDSFTLRLSALHE